MGVTRVASIHAAGSNRDSAFLTPLVGMPGDEEPIVGHRFSAVPEYACHRTTGYRIGECALSSSTIFFSVLANSEPSSNTRRMVLQSG